MKQSVVVEIRGGTLDAVYASDPAIEVSVVDWDDVGAGSPHGSVPFPVRSLEQMPAETRVALGEPDTRSP